MANRIAYDRLRTIEDVYRERLRIRVDIERRKHMLEKDMERVEEVFSPDYWLDIISVKAAEVVEGVTSRFASRIRGFSSGFGLLSGLVGKLTRRFRAPARDYGYDRPVGRGYRPVEYSYEEEDYYDPDEDEIDEIIFEENRTC